MTLADVPPGKKAKVAGYFDRFPSRQQAQLSAYGLLPGYWVEVIQQSPVTVIRLDHTEVALENGLAKGIEMVYD